MTRTRSIENAGVVWSISCIFGDLSCSSAPRWKRARAKRTGASEARKGWTRAPYDRSIGDTFQRRACEPVSQWLREGSFNDMSHLWDENQGGFGELDVPRIVNDDALQLLRKYHMDLFWPQIQLMSRCSITLGVEYYWLLWNRGLPLNCISVDFLLHFPNREKKNRDKNFRYYRVMYYLILRI